MAALPSHSPSTVGVWWTPIAAPVSPSSGWSVAKKTVSSSFLGTGAALRSVRAAACRLAAFRSLTDAIYQALPDPPFIALDQEGGRVSRLRAYGSMTYAGFKSYVYADLPRDDPRVELALGWLRTVTTVAGATLRGRPVATSTSHGPVFAERAQTLGAGRVLVGASVNQFHFKAVRGTDLGSLQLNFTHANTDFAGCDSIYGADCSKMGAPTLENEFIQLRLALDLDVRSTVFVLTYGLLDWVDVGVAVPLVSTSLRGNSEAQVVPFGGTSAAHFFGGTPTNPQLSATRFVEGSATGLGDISARAKIRLVQGERSAFAILADARFATGAEEDLLGSGNTSIRGLGVVSARFGAFSPHANVGYAHRTGRILTDAVLATGGFDHALADWATLAVDVLAELQWVAAGGGAEALTSASRARGSRARLQLPIAAAAILVVVAAPEHVQHVAERGLADFAAEAVAVDVEHLLHRLQLLAAQDVAQLVFAERHARAEHAFGLVLEVGRDGA